MIYDKSLRTLQVKLGGADLTNPVIKLSSEDFVEISFDIMSRSPRNLAYRLVHCDRNWNPSDIAKSDYMTGFDQQDITNYEEARNTTFDYTTYRIEFPNEDVRPTISGNYAVEIYDKEYPETVMAKACFYITEEQVRLTGKVSASTPLGVNNGYQMTDFTIDFSTARLFPTPEEVTVVVRQNGREDNMAVLNTPTFLKGNDFVYMSDKRLVFEAGKEYNKIDFSHIVSYSGEIQKIKFFRPYYHVELVPGSMPVKNEYIYMPDQNGRYKIHGQDALEETDIDYYIVHFAYNSEDPFLDGSLYVSGDFNFGRLDEKTKMVYQPERHRYELDIILKGGGYNFLYLFKPSGETAGETRRLYRSYWQTENEYAIYVYYRGRTDLYDRLVAVEYIYSTN